MQKRWLLKQTTSHSDLAGLTELSATILANRGVTSGLEVAATISPDYAEHLHDPFLMKDMAGGVKRILQAIKKQEKILIFGDYDADGVPASAVLACFFKQIGYEHFDVYIPDRHNEQYGLSVASIEKFAGEGVKLIITVDCGVSNIKEIKRAGELDLEVVVTDHHLPPAELPPAVAVINPKRLDDTYPYKFLAGTGVAFKLVQALMAKGKFTAIKPGWEKWLLDLVAIATVADMVPMTGENKVLTRFGLLVLKKTRRVGLLALFKALKLKQQFLVEEDIGFMIGPRLNSAGRMSHASQAYFLLMTDNDTEARTITTHLEEKNQERRSQVTDILAEADLKYQAAEIPAVVVLGRTEWGLGVLGLAAARISEKYKRTTFIWAKNGNGEIKGSCRSGGEVNVVDLMAAAGGREFFSDFGGHAFAGGFSLPESRLEQLEETLLKAYEDLPKTEVIEEEEADAKIGLDDITWATFSEVEKLAPYGLEFPKPVFWLEGVEIVAAKSFGKTGGHVELVFKNSKGESIPAIAFFSCEGELAYDQGHIWLGVNLAPGRRVDVLANIEKSTFKYKPELRLRIVDLKQSI
ncbi:MAG: single-stranded-DNA-specific exonuclease RecJ [Candidatus Vogelbacteria bacterium RIFOXYD1_FULL_46_19]|uniref:Single-stranded-DNA-specific exonuclease RecJ n=1 Tax=Candidatus Vogelbacteria bacterium RIFOXYD1_FULL_46_19 TaxID=1802439 RepID=A0A1G2QJR2_9BACT|nr:MAG: single-stranded-DNA-specific exonuclease RecJ [Candidatus Vogelbacteria bacterium RIFOXYD1_FULL_46_19]